MYETSQTTVFSGFLPFPTEAAGLSAVRRSGLAELVFGTTPVLGGAALGRTFMKERTRPAIPDRLGHDTGVAVRLGSRGAGKR